MKPAGVGIRERVCESPEPNEEGEEDGHLREKKERERKSNPMNPNEGGEEDGHQRERKEREKTDPRSDGEDLRAHTTDRQKQTKTEKNR